MGQVPGQMHAQLVRPSRFGDPTKAFVPDVVPKPDIGPDEVLEP